MKRTEQQPQDVTTLSFDRSTLRTLDDAALADVEGGTTITVPITAAAIVTAGAAVATYGLYKLCKENGLL